MGQAGQAVGGILDDAAVPVFNEGPGDGEPAGNDDLAAEDGVLQFARLNQRALVTSTPSGRASVSGVVAVKPSISEAGNGQACDPRYWEAVTRTPTSSPISRCTACSNDSPGSTKPARVE